eukprot:g27456.t1
MYRPSSDKDVPGKGGGEDVSRTGGDEDMPGTGGDEDVPGTGGDKDVLGTGGDEDVSVQRYVFMSQDVANMTFELGMVHQLTCIDVALFMGNNVQNYPEV